MPLLRNIQIYAKAIFIFVILTTALNSCETNETCGFNQPAPVVAVNGPTSGHVNQTVSFAVTFDGSNDCVQYGTVSEINEGFTRMIQVMANYESCQCITKTVARQVAYNFIATAAGTYYLNFVDTNNKMLIDTLVINP